MPVIGDEKADELFERFASECHKDRLEPYDWLLFFQLLIHVHKTGRFYGEANFTSELQGRRFDVDVITQLSDALNNGLLLLRAYDRANLSASSDVAK